MESKPIFGVLTSTQEDKSIKPTPLIGGHLGGEKYEHKGLFFFPREIYNF
jgi:hypothetical protein